MDIKRDDPTPLHYQLKNILAEGIKAGTWGMGDLFPTDKELMEKHQLSSTTVRRAISELVHEGWLSRKPGKGTFLMRNAVEERLGQLTGFFEEMALHGLRPSAEILRTGPLTIGNREVARYPEIKIFRGQTMFFIEKIQHVNGKPIVYLMSVWLYDYGKKIAEYDLTVEGIYQVVPRELGITLTKADQTICAGEASKEIAQYLGIKVGTPVLMMERITYAGEKPVEYSYNVYRGDQYKYKVALHHNSVDIGGVWG